MPSASSHFFAFRRSLGWVLAALAGFPFCASAVKITAGPTFTLAPTAPLAGTLWVTTDVASRVSVSVNDGQGTWGRDFFDYGTVHSVPLYGFKPGRVNAITVTVHDRARNQFTATPPLAFVTAALPADFPVLKLLVSNPAQMEPGYTVFIGANNNTTVRYMMLVDNQGQVVWYSSSSSVPNLEEVRPWDNGNFFLPLSTNFAEINLLGQTVHSWGVPNGLKIDLHEGLPTPHGTILYLYDDTRTVAGFPTSSTNPNAPKLAASLQFNRVIEMSAVNGALLNNWSLIDMLDPLRISYLTFTSRTSLGWDCEHANAIIEDPRDNSIIVSMRAQNAIIKFSRATGQLKWILGPPANWGAAFQPYLLTPLGSPFVWFYAQHAPMITPQGTLLIYDDGNFRASPFDTSVPDSANYSRAVEYAINEQTMQVSQVWDYGRTDPGTLYTPSVGNADWLTNTGNILVTFGNTTYVNGLHPSPYATNAAMVRIKEVTHAQPAQVVFDLALFDYANTSSAYLGCYAYRSHRVSDLYAHPASPVTDLNVVDQAGAAHLEFSADPARTYLIQVTTDLVHWISLAVPQPGPGGTYDFVDAASLTTPNRYYRVVTQ